MTRGRGLFLTFEGTEGSGKTTQMRLLVERLRKLGYPVVENQEPGGTAIGRQIRQVLLDPANRAMASMTELLLMFASRAQAAHEIIAPALERNDIVVSDRFTDSTLAYQGAARRIGFETVREAHRLALGPLVPDLTLCIEVHLEEGLARAHRRNAGQAHVRESRIDEEAMAFHCRVLEGYRQIAAAESSRFRMVDGSGDPNDVAELVWAEVEPLLHSRVSS